MTSLPRYFFDIHDSGAAEWDDAGSECANRAEIEQVARSKMAAFADRQTARAAPVSLAVLSVDGGVILTVTGVSSDEPRLYWR